MKLIVSGTGPQKSNWKNSLSFMGSTTKFKLRGNGNERAVVLPRAEGALNAAGGLGDGFMTDLWRGPWKQSPRDLSNVIVLKHLPYFKI